jgi:conjugal transfer pilus assembly protein TraW
MRCSEYLCQPRRHPGRMALVAVAMLLSLAAHAQDLGVIGPVYPIAEPSLLEVILARLRDAEASGVLARLQRDAQARAKHQIEQPDCHRQAHQDHQGAQLLLRPEHRRPLRHSRCRRQAAGPARNDGQSARYSVALASAALHRCARHRAGQTRQQNSRRARGKLKVILTGGSYLDLMRRWKRPVFFDQQGTLTEKLGIRHVPALVTQDGKRLKIEEIPG